MKKVNILIATVLLLFPFMLNGQRRLLIDEAFYQDSLWQWYDGSQFFAIQTDLPETWSIEEIAKGNGDWKSLTEMPDPNWESNCWLKLVIHNQQTIPTSIALLVHGDLFTAWYRTGSNLWTQRLGGTLAPRSQWDSRKHSPIYSSPHTLQLELTPISTTELYIKLGPRDREFTLQPKICNRSFFLGYSTWYFNRTIASQSFFHGVLWIMLLFHFIMYLMNRERAYLYYAAYIFCLSISLFYSFEFHYFTPLAAFPWLGRLLMIASTYGYIVFYSFFLIQFIHGDGWRPDLRRQIHVFNLLVMGVGSINLLLLLLPLTIFKLYDSYWLFFPLSMIGLLGLFRNSLIYWCQGNQLAKYIAATNFFILSGLLVSALIYYAGAFDWIHLRNSTFWGILFLELATILQLLSFSLSLSYKGLETERDRIRLQELDRLRSRFFANISHEFRTPLTLIMGPLRQLKATVNHSAGRKQLITAETYAQKLHRMVDQILELTKLEAGKLHLNKVVFDLVALAKMVTYSFQSITDEEKIELRFESTEEEIMVFWDREKTEQILLNLIGNAVKYNRSGGEVSVTLKKGKYDRVLLEVEDSGLGISKEALPHIFQLYYQGNKNDYTSSRSSSGIGLALTKELVELQQGTIRAESEEEKGSIFRVEIPLEPVPDQKASSGKTTESTITDRPQKSVVNRPVEQGQKPLVLIVEDHQDIRAYIQSCLQEHFQLLLAQDGEMGLELASRHVPDLVITDVMMPKMDGFALTHALKEETVTSHIPVIILTGKSSRASLLEGLRKQADEYLTKPFDAEELLLRVHNLLENRKKWIARYHHKGSEVEEFSPLPSMEAVFLEKVEGFVASNLGNDDYSVEKLGRDLRMDRTQLFRKLKAITGQNPSQFIRVFRLEKARELLQNRTATVAEIAFEVGFSNTSYFSRSFKSHFGKTPGEVMKEFNKRT